MLPRTVSTVIVGLPQFLLLLNTPTEERQERGKQALVWKVGIDYIDALLTGTFGQTVLINVALKSLIISERGDLSSSQINMRTLVGALEAFQ